MKYIGKYLSEEILLTRECITKTRTKHNTDYSNIFNKYVDIKLSV